MYVVGMKAKPDRHSGAQYLILAMYSGIIPSSAQGTYCSAGDQTRVGYLQRSASSNVYTVETKVL